MPSPEVTTTRPARWTEPFGAETDDALVDRLLGIAPFKHMDPAAFPKKLPLRDLLRGDTRVNKYKPGDLIVREGDYGTSAFILLHGNARGTVERLAALGEPEKPSLGQQIKRTIAQLWQTPKVPEARSLSAASSPGSNKSLGTRQTNEDTRLFLQDVPGVLDEYQTTKIAAGELFGEVAALARTPRTATVFAETQCLLLEIRWQGLRDLMRFSPALSHHVHQLYRKNSLDAHLSQTPLLAGLSESEVHQVAASTQFETHGSFDWHTDLPEADHETLFERIAREPLVAEEGTAPTGLLLVRSGFARVSQRRGDGHQTTAYLGKGQVFGASELARSLLEGTPAVLSHSLRAVGYVDLLRIPADIALDLVLPKLSGEELLKLAQQTDAPLPARTLDYLVDRRLMNGTQAMVIDLDRCTRCDDCVRACAATHGGNPRFVRQGPTHDHLQFANACLQCVDPVCMIGCPTGAIHRDAETGVVEINEPTCVGCSTCANSCPYSNIRMVELHEPGGAIIVDEATGTPIIKATKCDLCIDQLTGPACQHACPHEALVRIDVAEITPLAEWMQR